MKKRKKTFDLNKEVKAIARERVGRVKPSRPIKLKTEREKPKHKRPLPDIGNDDTGNDLE